MRKVDTKQVIIALLKCISDIYVLSYLLLFITAVVILNMVFQQKPGDILIPVSLFGILLPIASWLLFRKNIPAFSDRPAVKNETITIVVLILWITWYITYGTTFINQLVPVKILQIPWQRDLFILLKKLMVFFILPFLLYRMFGFSLKDFGFITTRRSLFNKLTAISFLVLAALIIVSQLLAGRGADLITKGGISIVQLITGLILCFAWNFLEAGLVEEFFFRALLQSRISVLTKSAKSGIILSGIIFGLSHAPGLYLRGAESEGIQEQLPFIFWAAYTITFMSVAGIFLGIIWDKTKNIWIIMAFHSLIDTIPNLKEFMQTWHI
jgi:membrane protease YdiL (CAAX protease family)